MSLQKAPDPRIILLITKTQGLFEASWRDRDERIRRCCKRLARKGSLERIWGPSGADYYKLPEAPLPPGFRPARTTSAPSDA